MSCLSCVMAFLTELKIFVLLVFLCIRNWVQRIRLSLGTLETYYGYPGGFIYKNTIMIPFLHTKERLDTCQQYSRFRNNDVLLLTYPKSGTHLTGEIIACIYKEMGYLKSTGMSAIVSLESQPPSVFHFRKSGTEKGVMWDVDAAFSPRIIKSHLPWSWLPRDVQQGSVKAILTRRNPKDVICSFYVFLRKMGQLPNATFNQFFDWFIEGNVIYGGYFQYLKEWYPHRNNPNLLNLTYEELLVDLPGSVRKIADFLGVKLSSSQVDNVVRSASFDGMRNTIGKSHPIFNKGKTGSWKSVLNAQQDEAMNRWIESEMEGLEDLNIRLE